MGTVPSSTGATGSVGPGPELACILHPARRVVADSTIPLSFKTRAGNQISRLQRELRDERERHEREVKELHDQNQGLAVSLTSRVEYSEAQWSRVQQRVGELFLEVQALELAGRSSTNISDASAQMANNPIPDNSTQTEEISSSNTTKHTPSTPAHAAVKSKIAIDELKEWHTSFNHVSGTPAQIAVASKSFFGRFQQEQKKNFRLSQSEDSLRKENEALARKFRKLDHENHQQRLRLQERRTPRTKPLSPPKSHSQKRKREGSEPDRHQNEPQPAFQTRRMEYSNSGWNHHGREGTIMAPWAAPHHLFDYQGFPVPPNMPSVPPPGGPIGSWGEPARYQYYAPPGYHAPPGYPMVARGPVQRRLKEEQEDDEEWRG